MKPQLSNLLGTLALALADAQIDAVQEASGIGTAGCATLVALGHYPGLTIREVAVIAGLSHSVMVRSIEGLASAGLVVKKPGRDKREVITQLTQRGMEIRQRLLAARFDVIGKPLLALSESQQIALHEMLAAMLSSLTGSRAQSDHMCRLCDEAACGPNCPVEQRVLEINKEI